MKKIEGCAYARLYKAKTFGLKRPPDLGNRKPKPETPESETPEPVTGNEAARERGSRARLGTESRRDQEPETESGNRSRIESEPEPGRNRNSLCDYSLCGERSHCD